VRLNPCIYKYFIDRNAYIPSLLSKPNKGGFLSFGVDDMMGVKAGDNVKVEYTGKLEDGTVFDSSERHGKPLEFEVGKGQVIKGFEEAVIGMEPGKEKEVKIPCEKAYGHNNPELVKQIPKEKLPTDKELKENMIILVGLPNGQQIPAKVVGVSETHITLDLNHPLAGKALSFKIKLVA
jgi:FKBP-type peptidyl-prolyl cis-trans isomerase 2